MIDLSGIQSTVSSLANIALVTPNEDIGIQSQSDKKSFMFDTVGEESVTLSSDVTDHYVEDNTALQDQISLRPETVTVTGYIGELNNAPPAELAFLKSVADRLSMLSPFLPAVSSTALIAYNTAAQAYATGQQAVSAAGSILNLLDDNTPTEIVARSGVLLNQKSQNDQQKAFVSFYQYWRNRQLFTVQTPWAIFNDMVIMSIRIQQDEDTRVISSFDITFKKMRFISDQKKTVQQGRLGLMSRLINNLGLSKPIAAASSFASKLG